MLVHICCSVDSHFFLQKLHTLYPNEKLVGFFYDPNIHPFSEYQLRLLDVRRSCAKLGIELHEGSYNYEGWLEAVKGLEEEPEKGKRCSVCFDSRLEESAKKAIELGEIVLTTTLLTSPKKSLQQLAKALEDIAQKYGLQSIAPDFRKGGGTQEQFALAKASQLYHQDYCGCLFALSKQRQMQDRWSDELCSPLRPQVLPSSIEERLMLYERVIKHEAEDKDVYLRREKFLNYRLLRAWVKNETHEVIPSYILFYSTCKKERVKGHIELQHSQMGFFSKEEIRFITLDTLNTLLNTEYKTVKALLFSPPSIESELQLRSSLLGQSHFSLTPIIVLDTLSKGSYEVYLLSKTYSDIREVLV